MNLIRLIFEICLLWVVIVAVKELMGGITHAEKTVCKKYKKKISKWADDV